MKFSIVETSIKGEVLFQWIDNKGNDRSIQMDRATAEYIMEVNKLMEQTFKGDINEKDKKE